MGPIKGALIAAPLLLLCCIQPGNARATVGCSGRSSEIGEYRVIPRQPWNSCYGPIEHYVVDRRGRRLATLQIGPTHEGLRLVGDSLLFWRSTDWIKPGLVRTDLRRGVSRRIYDGHFDDFFPSPKGTQVALTVRPGSLVWVDAERGASSTVAAAPPQPDRAQGYMDFDEDQLVDAITIVTDRELRGRPRMLQWSSDDRTFWFYIEGEDNLVTFVSVFDGIAELGYTLDGFFALSRDVEKLREVFDADRGLVFHFGNAPAAQREFDFEQLFLSDLIRGQGVLLGKRPRNGPLPQSVWDGSCIYVADEKRQRVARPESLFP